jgi:hypothetical protein
VKASRKRHWKRIRAPFEESEALHFLPHARDRDRAERMAAKLVHALPTTRMFKVDPTAPGYGLDTLFYAPTPDAFAATWLDRKLIGTALNHLESQQQPDGGWPISWTRRRVRPPFPNGAGHNRKGGSHLACRRPNLTHPIQRLPPLSSSICSAAA